MGIPKLKNGTPGPEGPYIPVTDCSPTEKVLQNTAVGAT